VSGLGELLLKQSANHILPLLAAGLSDEKFPGKVLNEDGAPSSSTATLKDITNNLQLQHDCLSPGAICVLALLNGPAKPTDSSSSGSEGWQLVTGLAKKFVGKPLRFAAVDASKQRSLRSGLGLEGGAGEVLPALAVVSGKRQRYVVMPGAFTQQAAEEFLDKVLSGSVTTAPLQVRGKLDGQQDSCMGRYRNLVQGSPAKRLRT
jgi:hypothetical protein